MSEEDVATEPAAAADSSSSSADASTSAAGADSGVDASSSSSTDGVASESVSSDSTASPASSSPPPCHPLQCAWTCWFSRPGERGGWGSNLKAVATVASVEDFWRLLHAVKPASSLSLKQDLHFFRSGIAPEWEDRQNREGGKWTVLFARGGGGRLDDAWTESLMLAVGEQLSESDDVTGLVIAPRSKETRLSLWTRTAKDEQRQRRIAGEWRQVLGDALPGRMEFQSHEDSMQAGTGYYRTQASYVL